MQSTSEHFTGIALELTPAHNFSGSDNRDTLRLQEFWKGRTGLGGALLQILVLSLLIQVFTLASPFYIQIVVDDVLIKNDQDLMTVLAIGFFGLTLFSVVTKMVRGYSNLYLANRFNYDVGNSVLHHLLRLPISYFEKRHIGDLVSRFGATRPIQEFVTNGAVAIVIDGLLALTTIALMLWYAPFLTIVVIVSLGLYALFRLAQFGPLRTAQNEDIVAGANLDSHFMETVRGMQGLKLANKELDRQVAWQNRFATCINTNTKLGRLGISFEALNNLITGSEYVLIIYLGAQEVLSNQLTIGMLYAFLAYRSHFSGAVISIINAGIQFKMLQLHLERLSDITQTAKEPDANVDSSLLLPVEGNLESRQLSFAYAEGEPPIFSDFSISITKGQFVAIFGASGVGKTTLLKCLMGLLSTDSGKLFIDGHPLNVLGQKSLRHNMAAVMQNEQLFSGTIRENVAFFDASIDPQLLQEACKQAEIHDELIASPMGYDSLIGDMGASLSAGQQQRVVLARGLYRKPKLLFLDEGTAHVDGPREQAIMRNLRASGITCVYVTHDSALLEFADQIVYWEKAGYPLIRQVPRPVESHL